jgi:hypothetical protein
MAMTLSEAREWLTARHGTAYLRRGTDDHDEIVVSVVKDGQWISRVRLFDKNNFGAAHETAKNEAFVAAVEELRAFVGD